LSSSFGSVDFLAACARKWRALNSPVVKPFLRGHTVDQIGGSLLRGQHGIQVNRLIHAMAPHPAMRALPTRPNYMAVSVYFML
jgi:hypothetical protein